MGRLPRVSHEPMVYKTWLIPARTPVSQLSYLVHHDPDIFPEPQSFQPERWLESREQGVRLDTYLVPFMKGNRNCVAINLAWAELRLALAYVLSRFHLELFETTEEEDVLVDRDMFFGSPKATSKGIRVVVLGKRDY
jgi:cytochrome P450